MGCHWDPVLFSQNLKHSIWTQNNTGCLWQHTIFPLIWKSAAPNSHQDHLSNQNIQVFSWALDAPIISLNNTLFLALRLYSAFSSTPTCSMIWKETSFFLYSCHSNSKDLWRKKLSFNTNEIYISCSSQFMHLSGCQTVKCFEVSYRFYISQEIDLHEVKMKSILVAIIFYRQGGTRIF